LNGYPPVYSDPSHPTQIYEAACYILTALVCLHLYWKNRDYKYEGLIFGVFLIGIFLSRFFIEFLKNNQEAFEEGMLLNMGQLLSIPFVIAGFWLAYKGWEKKRKAVPEKIVIEDNQNNKTSPANFSKKKPANKKK